MMQQDDPGHADSRPAERQIRLAASAGALRVWIQSRDVQAIARVGSALPPHGAFSSDMTPAPFAGQKAGPQSDSRVTAWPPIRTESGRTLFSGGVSGGSPITFLHGGRPRWLRSASALAAGLLLVIVPGGVIFVGPLDTTPLALPVQSAEAHQPTAAPTALPEMFEPAAPAVPSPSPADAPSAPFVAPPRPSFPPPLPSTPTSVPVSAPAPESFPGVRNDGLPTGEHPNPEPLVITLTFGSECWLRTSLDGGEPQERLLAPGRTITLRAEQEAALRIGDAGAVSVLINGRPTRPLGASGRAVNLRVTPSNVETFLQ